MNKHLKSYLISWVVITALYNIICFVPSETLFGFDKFGGAFWSSYAFTMVALVIHLAFMFVTLNKEQNSVSNLIVTLSYFEVVIMMAVSAMCMFIPDVPNWLGTVICSVVLGFSIIFTVTTNTATEKVVSANDALIEKTKVLRELTKEAEVLVEKYKGTPNEKDAKKIYDAIRYSDTNRLNSENSRCILTKLKSMIDQNSEYLSVNVIQTKLVELNNLIMNESKK